MRLFNFHEDILHQVDILIQSLLPPPREPPLVGWDVSARPAQSVAWVAQRRQLTGHTDGVGGWLNICKFNGFSIYQYRSRLLFAFD